MRLGATAAAGVAIAALAVLQQGKAVGVLLGVVLVILNGLLMYRERLRSSLAVAIQEEFDCMVFQLVWNDLLVSRRPTGQQIAAAARGYDGGQQHRGGACGAC